MGHIQTCAWCREPVHYREDLDTDEKSICDNCFTAQVRDLEKGRISLAARQTRETNVRGTENRV